MRRTCWRSLNNTPNSIKIPAEIIGSINGIAENSRLTDTVAAHLQLKLAQRQQILEIPEIGKRMEFLLAQLESELDIMQAENAYADASNAKWKNPSANII